MVIAASNNKDNKRNDIGMIVGVVFAMIVVAILVAISTYLLRWVSRLFNNIVIIGLFTSVGLWSDPNTSGLND